MVANVFLCSSERDARWMDRMLVHLRPLRKKGLLRFLHESEIDPGSERAVVIQEEISRSNHALLFLSPDFLNSDDILDRQVPPLLERNHNGLTALLPVLLRPCLYRAVPWLSGMSLRPSNDRAVVQGDDHQVDEDFSNIAFELVRRVNGPG